MELDNLPDELLLLVLRHLEPECPVLREVCQRWLRLTAGWTPSSVFHLAATGPESLARSMLPGSPR